MYEELFTVTLWRVNAYVPSRALQTAACMCRSPRSRCRESTLHNAGTLEWHGISTHAIWILQELYRAQTGQVIGSNDLSIEFSIKAGVRQGCVPSLRLLSFFCCPDFYAC